MTRISFIDVGQGTCTLFVDGSTGATLLVDCPPHGVHKAMEHLDAEGVTELTTVIVSHNDLDHLGGAYALARRYSARELYWNYGAKAIPGDPDTAKKLRAALRGILGLKEVGTTRKPIGVGSEGKVGELVWEAYAPTDDQLVEAIVWDDANIASAVLLLRAGKWRFLLPGDAECASWDAMSEGGFALDADVLAVPHHGALLAPSGDVAGLGWILDRVGASYAVVSAGNGYGHPHAEVVTELLARKDHLRTLFTAAPLDLPGPRGTIVFEAGSTLDLLPPHGP